VISGDPGANPGLGVFGHSSQLIDCGIDWLELWRPYADTLVIEKPTIYPHSKARPNDIVTLAISAGRLAERVDARAEVWVLPRQWKGQIPKTKRLEDYIIYKRVMAALNELERAVLAQHGSDHNVVDAVGIGLWHLGRL
jgi:hypothetical protein